MLKKTALLSAASLLLPFAAASAQVGTDVQAGADTATQPPEADVEAQAATAAPADPGPILPATDADFQPGVAVVDTNGGSVGRVESVQADGAVVDTGTNRVLLPRSSFAKSNAGLVISLTKAELDAQAAAAASGQQ